MQTKLYNQQGEEIGIVELPDKIFDVEIKSGLIHQAVLAQMANKRKPLAHAKGRGEVRGGGKKPWRQKGTGRARHGSIRSPIWKGGGVSHGPRKEKGYSQKINKTARRKALFMALSSKVKDGQLLVVDSLNLAEPKTKLMNQTIRVLTEKLPGYRKTKKKQDTLLLVQPDSNERLIKTVGNLSYAKIVRADSLNVSDILEKKYLVLLKDSIPAMEKTYLK